MFKLNGWIVGGALILLPGPLLTAQQLLPEGRGTLTVAISPNAGFPVRGGETLWKSVSQRDLDLQTARDICWDHATHVTLKRDREETGEGWWWRAGHTMDGPCPEIERLWISSGAAARIEAIRKEVDEKELEFVESVLRAQ